MVRRVAFPILVAVLLQITALSGASAQTATQFRLGFATLASMIPVVVGQPLESEHYGANGDSLQRTTTGLMVWRKADNWTAFTNGYQTWVNGPLGLQVRLNTERFTWENAAPVVQGAPSPSPSAASNAPTVVAWSPFLQDQKLVDALALAYGDAPDWRQYADIAAMRQTRVQWANLPQSVGGVTSNGYIRGALRVGIALNAALEQESTQVVAAVLAHETYHASTAENAGSGNACYQNEIDAYRWQAYVWRLLPRPANTTALVLDQDQVASLVSSGQIDSYIRNSPSYQQECGTP